jgi:tetratricopeptide (TPR) repeat protein
MQCFLLDDVSRKIILNNFISRTLKDLVEIKLKELSSSSQEGLKIQFINLEFYNQATVPVYFPSNKIFEIIDDNNFLEEVKKTVNPKTKRKILSYYVPFKINETSLDILKSIFILDTNIWLDNTSNYESSNLIPILEYLGFKPLNALLKKILNSNSTNINNKDYIPFFNDINKLQTFSQNLILTYFNSKNSKSLLKFNPNIENSNIAKKLLKESFLYLKQCKNNSEENKKFTDNQFKSFINSIITDEIDSKSFSKFLMIDIDVGIQIESKMKNSNLYIGITITFILIIMFFLYGNNYIKEFAEKEATLNYTNNLQNDLEIEIEKNIVSNKSSSFETNNISETSQKIIEENQHISKQSISYNNLGIDYYNKHNLDFSLEYFLKAIESDPRNSVAYFNAGLVHFNKGNTDLALEYYETAIKKNPTYSAAYFNIGLLYFNKGEIKKAISYYTSAIELDSNYSTAYNNLGLSYYQIGDKENSEKNYIKSLQLDPKNSIAHFNLGLLYYTTGSLEKAKQKFIEALELDNKYVNAYYHLANTYYDLGDKDNAIEYYIKCLNLDKSNYIVYFNLGLAYYSKGEFENALNFFQKTIELNPRYSPAYFNIGFIYYSENKYEYAIRYYKKAISLNPNNNYAKLSLGLSYYHLDKYELAIEQFNLVKEIENSKQENERDQNILSQVDQFKKEVYAHIDKLSDI